jgi:hypothetical protein
MQKMPWEWDVTAPFRIFSGWDKRQTEAAEVFAFSVRERASIPVEIRFLSADAEVPGGPTCARRGVTAFSYSRFYAPYLCDYVGTCLVLDGCDQLCLTDVAELVAIPMDGCAIKVVKHTRGSEERPRSWTSLMLMDCAAPELQVWIPKLVEVTLDDRLMRLRDVADARIGELPVEWNALCAPGIEPPAGTKIAHWSYLSQPDGGSWIQRSGSKIWEMERKKWLAAR